MLNYVSRGYSFFKKNVLEFIIITLITLALNPNAINKTISIVKSINYVDITKYTKSTNLTLTLAGFFVMILFSYYEIMVKIEIYNAIKENRNLKVKNTFLNIKNYGFDMFKLFVVTSIKLILWTLLLIIPGIVKLYQYQRVFYIKANNPEISNSECFDISKEEMDGRKFKLFSIEFLFGLLTILIMIIPIILIIISLNYPTPIGIGFIFLSIISIIVVGFVFESIGTCIEPLFNIDVDDIFRA